MLYEEVIEFCRKHKIGYASNNRVDFHINLDRNSIFIDDRPNNEFYIGYSKQPVGPSNILTALKQCPELAAFWIPNLL